MLLGNDFAPTDKFLIVASGDPDLLCFAINSRINAYIRELPSLLQCQVLLKRQDHAHFLKVDSHADCSKVISAVRLIKAVSQLVADPSRMKGRVTASEGEAIIQAVKNARTMPEAQRQRIFREWGVS
jgi:hypothetical protein